MPRRMGRIGRPGLLGMAARTTVAPLADRPGDDVGLVAQLNELTRLKEAGTLDDAEYAAAKAKLLA